MTNGNDSAYPIQDEQGGLTKREHFAAMAMQGISTAWSEGGIPWHDSNPRLIGERAVDIADALIAELNKEEIK